MYSFYFGSLKLPVTPQKLTTKIKGSNKTLTLVNESDINFLRAPGLTEISFDVVLPMLGSTALRVPTADLTTTSAYSRTI